MKSLQKVEMFGFNVQPKPKPKEKTVQFALGQLQSMKSEDKTEKDKEDCHDQDHCTHIHEVLEDKGAVSCCCISTNAETLFYSEKGNIIKIWDV